MLNLSLIGLTNTLNITLPRIQMEPQLTRILQSSRTPLKGFAMIKTQSGFIYGDTIRKAYGFDGATVHGSISGGNAQVELSFPIPFRSFGPVNQQAAAAYAEAQADINAMSALHEILHLAGKRRYDDIALANAVAAMRGVEPLDLSGMTPKEAARRASDYWNGALEAACKPR